MAYLILDGQISVSKEDRGFNRQQKEEELNKLTWCETHPESVESLFHLEDHHLLYGCTAIADLEKPDMIEKLRAFLNLNLQTISRALLTYGDYSQTINNNYTQIANGTEDVWKQLLHPSNQRVGFENTRRTISTLLENSHAGLEELNERIDSYLQAIDTLKDWRYYFIKYPCILSKPANGKYDRKNSYLLNILSANTYRGRYWDAISFAIYNKYGETENLFMGNWGNPLTLPSGNKLVNCQESFIIRDSEGATIYEERIPQSNGLDDEDRVELALSLIKKY